MKHIIIILMIALSIPCFAKLSGQALIDSMKVKFSNTINNKDKIMILCDISEEYATLDTAEGLKYGNKGLLLAEKINWVEGKVLCFNSLSYIHEVAEDYHKAVEYAIKAYKLLEMFGNLKKIADQSIKLGFCYKNLDDYENALDYFKHSMKIGFVLKDDKRIADSYFHVGDTYLALIKYEEAINNFKNALKYYKYVKNQERKLSTLNMIYVCLSMKGNHDEAKYYKNILDSLK